jgi:hypothetical protein
MWTVLSVGFVNYSHGFKGLLNSDFKYEKIQLYYKQPIIIGPLGERM